MSAINFASSYMTFTTPDRSNTARIQLDAHCRLVDEEKGASDEFVLIAPCRTESMYLPDDLFRIPNYEFCGIFGTETFMIIRTGPSTAHGLDNREPGLNQQRFHEVRIDIRTFPRTRLLQNDEEVYRATLDNLPLIARTEVDDPASRRRAVIEYPIKTMNVSPQTHRFQVDTGPVLLPDFTAQHEHLVERFVMAHVVYNTFDRAEFIVRQPTPIVQDGREVAAVMDYQGITVMPARHQIVCADMTM